MEPIVIIEPMKGQKALWILVVNMAATFTKPIDRKQFYLHF